MRNSDDYDKDDDKTTQRDIDRSLARKLLSEEELRYFSGKDKPSKPNKLRFFKRRHVSSHVANNVANNANLIHSNNAGVISNIAIAADKLAVVSAQQSRGAEILIAIIVLILFMSAAGLFLFNTNVPDESIVHAVSSLKQTKVVDRLDEVVLSNVDNLTSNEDLALVDESVKLLDIASDSEQAETAIVAAINDEDLSANTIREVIPQKTVEPAATTKTDLPEQSSTISFEEFAAEAEVTVYREEE